MTVCDQNELKELIEKKLTSLNLPLHPQGLYAPIRYTLEGGGKRLRPLLMLATVQAFGGDPRVFVNQALALELYHNSTLIHDDVMDNSDMRHGRLTVHKKWNATTAVLSGDAMISIANRLMVKDISDEKSTEVVRIFNDFQLQVDEGQQMDIDFENSTHVSPEDYRQMILGKTGALFACAIGIGSLLASAKNDPDSMERFKKSVNLGYLFGEIFQLQDDMLDSYGDESKFGKPVGQDILNNKKTWLSVSILNSKERKKALSIIERVNKPSEKIERMIELYDSEGLKEKLQKLVESKFMEAYGMLEKLTENSPKESKQVLYLLFDSISNRNK